MNKQSPVSLKSALKKHYANKTLSTNQLEALQKKQWQQIKTVRVLHQFKWLGSIAASVLLLVAMLSYFQTPALITSAYADIYKDANLNNGLQPTMQQWLSVNKIANVPSQYPVKMSKFCRLGKVLTTHLRIAGKEQGELNVFIQQGKNVSYWMNKTGRVDSINWKLLNVRDDLTVIVLYTQDMREKAVQHILREMLPALEV